MNYLLYTLFIILLLLVLLNNFLHKKPKLKNQILMVNLKRTLPTLSNEDIKDLIRFLLNEYIKRLERKFKNESKKSRKYKISH